MRARELSAIVAGIDQASQGIGLVEAPRHLGAARVRAMLTTVRRVRLTLQTLEARLEQALEIREAG